MPFLDEGARSLLVALQLLVVGFEDEQSWSRRATWPKAPHRLRPREVEATQLCSSVFLDRAGSGVLDSEPGCAARLRSGWRRTL